jgi:hypothetical protein
MDSQHTQPASNVTEYKELVEAHQGRRGTGIQLGWCDKKGFLAWLKKKSGKIW